MCEACDLTEKNPNSGRYNADCDGCKARSIALSPAFFQSMQAGRMTAEYKRLLTLAFGDVNESRHQQVKQWAERMKEQA